MPKGAEEIIYSQYNRKVLGGGGGGGQHCGMQQRRNKKNENRLVKQFRCTTAVLIVEKFLWKI